MCQHFIGVNSHVSDIGGKVTEKVFREVTPF